MTTETRTRKTPTTAPRRTRRLQDDPEERRRQLIRTAAKLAIMLHYDALVELGRR